MAENNSWFRNNFQFIYSVILIILIPLALAANTYLVVNNNQKNADIELQRKAALAEEIFAAGVADSLGDAGALQKKIDDITTKKDNLSQTEIAEISVLSPQNDGYVTIAASNKNNLGLPTDSLQYSIAWSKNQSIATLISNDSQRYWNVITPLVDSAGEKQAIVDMKVSLADADALTTKDLRVSMIVLIISILVIVLLLVNHFRFFEYAVLFKRLKEVDAMKDDFISIASHELRTPLTAVNGYISMIREGIGGSSMNAKASEYMSKVTANTKRLDSLVSELLDISRLEQGRMKFDFQPTDISPLISQVISELQVKADEKHLALKYEPLPDPHPLVSLDQNHFVEVLDNLIGNAIKYTLQGSVQISHKIEKGQLKTIIKDTGVGMSAEDRKNLFQKFYRIKTDKTKDIQGTGLGLWITREIIHKMKGEIFVDSMEDVGSQFIVSFPITRDQKSNKQGKENDA